MLLALTKVCRYGRYNHRLIIPILEDGETIGFVARDMSGKHEPKYLIEPKFPLHNYLYNIDSIKYNTRKLYIVEGVKSIKNKLLNLNNDILQLNSLRAI